MRMTKKHFKAIAEIIAANLKTYGGDVTAKKAIESISYSLSNFCYTVNPNFNYQTFLDACGIKTQ